MSRAPATLATLTWVYSMAPAILLELRRKHSMAHRIHRHRTGIVWHSTAPLWVGFSCLLFLTAPILAADHFLTIGGGARRRTTRYRWRRTSCSFKSHWLTRGWQACRTRYSSPTAMPDRAIWHMWTRTTRCRGSTCCWEKSSTIPAGWTNSTAHTPFPTCGGHPGGKGSTSGSTPSAASSPTATGCSSTSRVTAGPGAAARRSIRPWRCGTSRA